MNIFKVTAGLWDKTLLISTTLSPLGGSELGLRALSAPSKAKQRSPKLPVFQTGIIAWQRLQGPNRILPNLLLSFAMSKLWSAANAGCCSADLFLNTCQHVIKWTSLPPPGFGEELLLLQEQIPSAACSWHTARGEKAGAAASNCTRHSGLGAAGDQPKLHSISEPFPTWIILWITSRPLSGAPEGQHVPISWYHWELTEHPRVSWLDFVLKIKLPFILHLNAYNPQPFHQPLTLQRQWDPKHWGCVWAVAAPQHHGVRAAQEWCLSTEQQEKCFPYAPWNKYRTIVALIPWVPICCMPVMLCRK